MADLKRVFDFTVKLHQSMDEKANEFYKCCNVGCSYCCFQSIEIFYFESNIIAKFLNEDVSHDILTQIRDNLNNWLDYFDKNTPNDRTLTTRDVYFDFRDLIVEDEIACPFLIEHKCSIYPVRPMTCRAHFVQDSPNLCKQDKLRDSCNDSKNIREVAVKYITFHINSPIIILPYAIHDILGLDRELKPIEIAYFSR